VWLGSWVDVSVEEWLFDNFRGINVLEGGHLFSMSVDVNLEHFPSEHYIDSSLVALIKSDLIGIWELEDLFVWCPILNLSISSIDSMEFILSQK
jgi:hypothetical protein